MKYVVKELIGKTWVETDSYENPTFAFRHAKSLTERGIECKIFRIIEDEVIYHLGDNSGTVSSCYLVGIISALRLNEPDIFVKIDNIRVFP